MVRVGADGKRQRNATRMKNFEDVRQRIAELQAEAIDLAQLTVVLSGLFKEATTAESASAREDAQDLPRLQMALHGRQQAYWWWRRRRGPENFGGNHGSLVTAGTTACSCITRPCAPGSVGRFHGWQRYGVRNDFDTGTCAGPKVAIGGGRPSGPRSSWPSRYLRPCPKYIFEIFSVVSTRHAAMTSWLKIPWPCLTPHN